MIAITEYKGQKVGVFGLGKAGEAAVRALETGGAIVSAWDDKSTAEAGNKINFKNWDWGNLKAVVLSPGVPLTHPKPHAVVELANKYHVPVIGEMELLFRAQPEATYIGITGTNGKSTTTTLIGHILKESGVVCEVGGNLGTPALALAPLGKDGVYVIEMSSYQLDLVKTVRFNVALLLNITPDHIDRHGDMQGYIAAKYNIFNHQEATDTAIVSIDDDNSKWVYESLNKGKRQKLLAITVFKSPKGKDTEPSGHNISVSSSGMIYDRTDKIITGGTPLDVSNIASLTGSHNWQNAAAAYAACKAVGVAPDNIYAAMKTFGGLRHRLQLVAEIGGVRFINDSKATNADATQNALAPYTNILWIAGGKAKEGGISSLTEYFPNVKHAFLIGEAEADFAATLEGKIAYTRCGTLENAVAKAAEMAQAGDVVLLSPACASFDQFKSFEHRGDVFCELVEAIEKKVTRHAS